jgi:pimeloyl-ACP methyl ester carboxylesterase
MWSSWLHTIGGSCTRDPPQQTPSPPLLPPLPHSHIPYPFVPLRSRAFNSQAAALVRLWVRSTQHAALMQRICVPTLFVHARDDPAAPLSTLPFPLLQAKTLDCNGAHTRRPRGVHEER